MSSILIPMIFFIVVAVLNVKKANKAAKEQEKKYNRAHGIPDPRPAVRSGFASSAASLQSAEHSRSVESAYNRQFASQSFDSTHYHSEGYDFDTCMSFKDVPDGQDELAYLVKTNRRHEKELEQLLQISSEE